MRPVGAACGFELDCALLISCGLASGGEESSKCKLHSGTSIVSGCEVKVP